MPVVRTESDPSKSRVTRRSFCAGSVATAASMLSGALSGAVWCISGQEQLTTPEDEERLVELFRSRSADETLPIHLSDLDEGFEVIQLLRKEHEIAFHDVFLRIQRNKGEPVFAVRSTSGSSGQFRLKNPVTLGGFSMVLSGKEPCTLRKTTTLQLAYQKQKDIALHCKVANPLIKCLGDVEFTFFTHDLRTMIMQLLNNEAPFQDPAKKQIRIFLPAKDPTIVKFKDEQFAFERVQVESQ